MIPARLRARLWETQGPGDFRGQFICFERRPFLSLWPWLLAQAQPFVLKVTCRRAPSITRTSLSATIVLKSMSGRRGAFESAKTESPWGTPKRISIDRDGTHRIRGASDRDGRWRRRAHPAGYLLADDPIRRVRPGILDVDRLLAGILDRSLPFRSEGHGHLPVPIPSARLACGKIGVGSVFDERENRTDTEYLFRRGGVAISPGA
jgi:hypothetical protein